MAGKIYIVEGRQFKTDAEYNQALKDQETIEKLRAAIKDADITTLKELQKKLESGKYRFNTLLGEDFIDEVGDKIKALEKRGESNGKKGRQTELPKRRLADDKTTRRRQEAEELDDDDEVYQDGGGRNVSGNVNDKRTKGRNSHLDREDSAVADDEIEAEARRILRNRDIRRRVILILSIGIGLLSLAVFTYLYVTNSFSHNDALYQLREKADQGRDSRVDNNVSATDDSVVIHYTDTSTVVPDVLPEFEEMLAINSKLIGWLTIDGTTIDYPVAQTSDNEYYLTHDLYQNYDRNGTIFLDCNCDVLKPSTNLILYGHHMQSGKMFGNLVKYENESYYEKHKYITFDTIYEYGTYEIIYVFRSHVYEETEIAFKYYQFYDAYSEIEFNSYMNEMAEMSLYDTGVTAEYGDRLLTLSTCDYQETNGRFVVVAKKIN